MFPATPTPYTRLLDPLLKTRWFLKKVSFARFYDLDVCRFGEYFWGTSDRFVYKSSRSNITDNALRHVSVSESVYQQDEEMSAWYKRPLGLSTIFLCLITQSWQRWHFCIMVFRSWPLPSGNVSLARVYCTKLSTIVKTSVPLREELDSGILCQLYCCASSPPSALCMLYHEFSEADVWSGGAMCSCPPRVYVQFFLSAKTGQQNAERIGFLCFYAPNLHDPWIRFLFISVSRDKFASSWIDVAKVGTSSF